jgi:hypothetical protein
MSAPSEVEELRRTVKRQSAAIKRLQQKVEDLRSINLSLMRTTIAPGAALDLDADRVRELLQLCHPDKHHGSALANKATRWLLDHHATRAA